MAYAQAWAILPLSSADLRTWDGRLDHLGNPRMHVQDNEMHGQKIYYWEISPNGDEEYTAVSMVLEALPWPHSPHRPVVCIGLAASTVRETLSQLWTAREPAQRGDLRTGGQERSRFSSSVGCRWLGESQRRGRLKENALGGRGRRSADRTLHSLRAHHGGV